MTSCIPFGYAEDAADGLPTRKSFSPFPDPPPNGYHSTALPDWGGFGCMARSGLLCRLLNKQRFEGRTLRASCTFDCSSCVDFHCGHNCVPLPKLIYIKPSPSPHLWILRKSS